MDILRSSGRYGFSGTLRHAGLASPFEPGQVEELAKRALASMEAFGL